MPFETHHFVHVLFATLASAKRMTLQCQLQHDYVVNDF